MTNSKQNKILVIKSTYGTPDSRCEKEIYSLSKRHRVDFLGWNRNENYNGVITTPIRINDIILNFYHIGIKTSNGKGFMTMIIPLIKFWFREWRFLKKNVKKYDVIHACDFDAAFPLIFISKRPPLVYDIFDYYADTHYGPSIILSLIRSLENRIICLSNVTILCSETRKQQIYPACPKKLVIIHNSPPENLLQNAKINDHCLKQDIVKIVYVGALAKDRFLAEMAEVISERKDIELHVGGIGPLADCLDKMSQIYPNIIYYGQMNYGNVLLLELHCDIMTAIYDPRTPNHRYAAPNKFYESLMLKKPVIMIKNTGMDAYVEKYQLGEVIDVAAEVFKEGFTRALDNLIAKKSQWIEMGKRGFQLYQEQFSWQEMERRLLNIYDDIETE